MLSQMVRGGDSLQQGAVAVDGLGGPILGGIIYCMTGPQTTYNADRQLTNSSLCLSWRDLER